MDSHGILPDTSNFYCLPGRAGGTPNVLGNGPQNQAILRHMALIVMQKDGSKEPLRSKFQRAGWDNAYLTRLLALF